MPLESLFKFLKFADAHSIRSLADIVLEIMKEIYSNTRIEFLCLDLDNRDLFKHSQKIRDEMASRMTGMDETFRFSLLK